MQRFDPPICGYEAAIHQATHQQGNLWLEHSNIHWNQLQSGFSCALHMHQPTVPAGPNGAFISHLQYMAEHPGEGDNHNAEPFAQCYRRLADLLPQLIAEGCNPRMMLDYSGNLLWGIGQMGRSDISSALKFLATDALMQRHIEWLGTFWSHAVAPSTPIPDLRLQISAWQHQFFDLFGADALARVKGFSLPEMHLPNHPDTLYALIEALLESGYRWLLVQEHSVEQPDGTALTHGQKYGPNRLVARNSQGEELSITALIKTQGSDTKLVGQMQPYYEALSLGRLSFGQQQLPSLVAQIADGENGGVMMNEFPAAFEQANRRLRDDKSNAAAINGSEYLEWVETSGLKPDDYPAIQAVGQARLFEQMGEAVGPDAVSAAITALQAGDGHFAMEGASWTNSISWVEGYSNVLEPMKQLSAQFHRHFGDLNSSSPGYHQALLHVLLLETSCFRYWGQGTWTDYAEAIFARGEALMGLDAAA